MIRAFTLGLGRNHKALLQVHDLQSSLITSGTWTAEGKEGVGRTASLVAP